jgi:hypothetical protein
MNKSPESQSPKLKAIRSRWLACTQSTGRVGKSTAAEGIITWLRYAGVAYAAYDADGEHRTLSSRYPDDVEKFDAANSPEEFGRLLERISEDFPVTLVDFPAQATFKEALPADEAEGEELRAAQIQQLNKILGGMKVAIDPLPVHLSRAATSEQFNALARTIDQQMSDLSRRQQDWRSALDKEAAELREKVAGLDKTVQGFATGLDQLNALVPRACGPGRLDARVDHVPDHSVFDGLGAACHRLVSVSWARSCNSTQNCCPGPGIAARVSVSCTGFLMESFRKLIECLMGAWWIVWKS